MPAKITGYNRGSADVRLRWPEQDILCIMAITTTPITPRKSMARKSYSRTTYLDSQPIKAPRQAVCPLECPLGKTTPARVSNENGAQHCLDVPLHDNVLTLTSSFHTHLALGMTRPEGQVRRTWPAMVVTKLFPTLNVAWYLFLEARWSVFKVLYT